MAITFIFINSLSKKLFLQKYIRLKIYINASTGRHGKFMKYTSFPWPLVVAAHNLKLKFLFYDNE